MKLETWLKWQYTRLSRICSLLSHLNQQMIITNSNISLKFSLPVLLFVQSNKQKEQLPITIFLQIKVENFHCQFLDIHHADNWKHPEYEYCMKIKYMLYFSQKRSWQEECLKIEETQIGRYNNTNIRNYRKSLSTLRLRENKEMMLTACNHACCLHCTMRDCCYFVIHP